MNDKAIIEVSIRRMGKIPVAESSSPMGKALAATAASNLAHLGYALNGPALQALAAGSVAQAQNVIGAARSLKRADAGLKLKPMYPNFPKQVMDAAWVELYFNAVAHYCADAFGLRLMPKYDEAARQPLLEGVELQALGVASDEDMEALASRILTQPQAYSQADKDDLVVLASHMDGSSLPPISIKENVTTLIQLLPQHDWTVNLSTVVDALRLATAYSGGDVSLSFHTRFSLKRPDRRRVVAVLERAVAANACAAEDFLRHEEEWKRLARTLHLGTTGSPALAAALTAALTGQARSFDSRLETALKGVDVKPVLALLTERPGTFARRLAEVLRKFPSDEAAVIKAFASVARDVPVLLLVRLWEHYTGPLAATVEKRVILTKGSPVGMVIPHRLDSVPASLVPAIEAGLKNRISKKVFLEPEAGTFTVPLGLRSASPGLRLVGRGSRIPVKGHQGTIRLFLHWKDISPSERVDLDLSAVFMDAEFKKSGEIAYYNLRDGGMGAVHSGDILSAPNGAAEYIDIPMAQARKAGWRYVALTVYSFSRQPLSSIPEAYVGAMLRSASQDGEIFEPSTVRETFALTGAAVNSTPVLFDLETRELIWVDLAVSARGYFNAVAANRASILETLRASVEAHHMDVPTLFALAAKPVKTRKAADVVISPARAEEVLSALVEEQEA